MCVGVNLPPESYFEDESAQPISLMQIFDEEAKREHGEKAAAILLGHPESIVRHVPAEPVRAELWSQMDADLVDHLFDVYTELVQSRWLQARCVVASGARGEYRAILPVPEDCMAVILPFRQLYSRDSADDLFNRCCKIHNRHCPSKHVTYWWVAEYQSRFNTLLEEPVTFPLSCPNLPARRYLDAFAYGAKIVHASSRSTDPAADLAALLAGHRKELVVMGYHSILRTLLSHVSMALAVLGHNVNHWIYDLGWREGEKPGRRHVFGAGT